MPRRPAGSVLWSELIQVMVAPETKAALVELAAERGVSQSQAARDLIEQGLGFTADTFA